MTYCFRASFIIALSLSLVFVTYSEANDLKEVPSASDDTQVLGAEKETSKILNQADAIELLLTKERLNASEASQRLVLKRIRFFQDRLYHENQAVLCW